MWNQLRVEPLVCAALQRAEEKSTIMLACEGIWAVHPRTRHSRLGAPVRHPDFVWAHHQRTVNEHQTLLEMIPLLLDVH